MQISLKTKKEVAHFCITNYFVNAKVERVVLEYLMQKAFNDNLVTTKEIYEHLEENDIVTSVGAIRGTILRVRHKLLKYREENPDHAIHIVFPEPEKKRGYLLKFERNPNYHVARSKTYDPWLMKNWEVLRQNPYNGLWKGLSLPDGGRWPLKLYVWVHTLCDTINKREKFMFLIHSPSTKKPRIGILEGEVKDSILYMEGNWSSKYEEKGIIDYKMKAQMWPFRRSEDEMICFSGRFYLYTKDDNPYQEGQVELKYCPLDTVSKEDISYIVDN